MQVLINELSFMGQGGTIQNAAVLMRTVVSILRELKPIQGSDPIYVHSTLATKQISSNYTVHQWARTTTDKESRQLFLILTSKGPFIDRVLDEQLAYHECYFNDLDVSTSSIAGAAYFKGALVSLQNALEFAQEILQVQFSADGIVYEEIGIRNLTNPNQVRHLRRSYIPSPKHDAQSGWGTPMDLTDQVAQELLDSGILCGKQVYNWYAGKFYEFQPDNAGGYHGYPIPLKEVPALALKELKARGVD